MKPVTKSEFFSSKYLSVLKIALVEDSRLKIKGKTVKKSNLPTKVCPVCDRPFTWRKKWERDWENVIYCSKRCQNAK